MTKEEKVNKFLGLTMINYKTAYRPSHLFGKRRASIRCVMLALLFGWAILAVARPRLIPLFVEDDEINYNWFIDCEEPIDVDDEHFYDNSATILFRVNKYGLPKNDKTLNELKDVVLPRINQDSLELIAIVIRGGASPEGPYWLNKQLSEKRAKALTDFVTSHLTYNALNDSTNVNRNLSQIYEVEDYRSLCIMMKKAADPDYRFVKDLCDKYLADKKEEQLKEILMKAQGGRLWNRMLKQYFPKLRAARIMLFFRKHQPKPEVVVPPTPVVPAEPLKRDSVVVLPPIPVEDVESTPITETLERKKLLAIKTNMLLYGVYVPGYNRWAPIPNVAVEYYPQKGHFTYGASFDMPWWQDYNAHKYFQFRNYQVETRYYLNGANKANGANGANETNKAYNRKAFMGFYLQGYAHLAVFGICFDENRGWVGEGVGAGIGAGFVTPISKNGHWKLEFSVQAGFFTCKYDPYQFENPVNPAYRDGLYYYKWTKKPSLFEKRQYRWNWIGPTRIGITLSYDLLYRRIQKKGASFINKERRVTP